MAITSTTLAADLSATSLTLSLTSGTGFPTVGAQPQNVGFLVRVDDEYMWAIYQPVANTVKVRARGALGTAAVAHDILSRVHVSADPQDFTGNPAGGDVPLPPYSDDRATIGEDLTFTSAQIAALARNTIYSITKATAAAIVLVAPGKAQDGLKIMFTSQTAAIHVVTATALLANAGASSPYTTATTANAKIGGALELVAQNGLWNVIAQNNWTIT